MTSYLQRSAQQIQLSPQRRGVEDVFSEFRSFRNETKRKAETSHSKLLMDSPQRQSQVRFQPFGSNSFVGGKTSSSQIFQLSSNQSSSQVVPNTRHASNISPQKKSTVGIQQLSPQKSYLYRENLHEQCQQHSQLNNQFARSSVINPISSGLDNFQREIKEISFSKHFNHQVNAARQESKKKLANLSPSKRNPLIQSQQSPVLNGSSKLFGSNKSTGISQLPQGISSLYISSQYQSSPQKRRNSQQPRNLNSSASFYPQGQVISYSPTRQSQRLFSPNRLLNRLSSPTESQFQDFEFVGTSNSPKINFKPNSPLTSQIPGSSSLGGGQYALRRSNSASGNGLTQLLNDTRHKIKNNGLASNLSPSNSFVKKNNINLNNSSYLSPNARNSEIFNSSKTSYIVDKRAHDLEDYLRTLTPQDFNQLPRDNVEQLIKLSSVIMSKVKNSHYYRGSIF